MTKNHPVFSRINDVLFVRLQSYQRDSGKSESEIVREALTLFLNPDIRALISMKQAGLVIMTTGEFKNAIK